MQAAHGANENFKLDQELKRRERIGAYAMADRYIAELIRMHLPGRAPGSIRVLDVGTGQGYAIKRLRELGYDAHGLEPGGRYADTEPTVLPYVYRVYSQDFPQAHPDVEKFDFIFSNGVVEHVGTTDGNADLVPDYLEYRKTFINSQLALLRDGGILVVIGPNRLFPLDFQHGDHYYGFVQHLDRIPFLKYTTIPWHPRNHLCSYDDIKRLTQASDYDVTFLNVSQRKYCSLTALEDKPMQKAIFKSYVSAVSFLPFGLRKFLETHTVFVCKLNARGGAAQAVPSKTEQASVNNHQAA
jgi:SAM-dependent methyltransferase